MHDVTMTVRENPSASPAPKPSSRRVIGRFTLDMRQTISPAKQAGILAGSLAIGLIISVAILDLAGIAPLDLAGELAGVFNADSLRSVLVRAAPLILVDSALAWRFASDFGTLAWKAR